jgi:hypothetical protein
MRMEGGGGGAGVGGCLGLGHGGEAQIKGTHTHGGRYVQYNVYGNLFEVSAKYVPPIRPVGRGSCGIIWCVPPSSSSIAFVRAHSPAPFFFVRNFAWNPSCLLGQGFAMGPTTTRVAVHRLLQETILASI